MKQNKSSNKQKERQNNSFFAEKPTIIKFPIIELPNKSKISIELKSEKEFENLSRIIKKSKK
jgi:hypothetical protein